MPESRDKHFPRPRSQSFFVARSGRRLSYGGARWHFERLARAAGLVPRSPNRRPRLHDFRHGFACATFEDCYKAGSDVQARPPLLSAYLGHVDPDLNGLVLVGQAGTAGDGRRALGATLGGRAMNSLAPLLQSFFTERLVAQRRVSPHTVASYRDTFRLLLRFAEDRTGKAPSQLGLADLDAGLIGAFLDHLERQRHNSVRTRNARLVATQSTNNGVVRFISAHPDQDHISGLVELGDHLSIVNFYCVKNATTKSSPTSDFKRYCSLRGGNHAFYLSSGCQRRWMNLDDEDRSSSGLNALWPTTADPDFKSALADVAAGMTPNNISIILQYKVQNGPTMLWMGDLERDFMEKIEDKVKIPTVDILFAPTTVVTPARSCTPGWAR